jgi:hypothetical protein
MFDQAAWGDDQATLQVAPNEQLLDEQSGHDRFASTAIICQQEPKRLTRQHLAVHSCQLVRERLDLRGTNGEERIEEMGETDAERFRC